MRFTEAKRVGQAMHTRYEPVRALALISRLMLKGVFAGRSDEVVFWALVHAHYRGSDPGASNKRALDALEDQVLVNLNARE